MLSIVNPRVKSFLISDSFYYASYDVMGAFLAILVTNEITNGSAEMLGFVIAYGMLVRPLIQLPLSKISKKITVRGKIKIVGISTIIGGLLLVLMGQATQIWHVFVIQTLFSISESISFPLKWGIFTKILDKRNVEFEWTLEDMVTMIPSAISAALAGLISITWGLSTLFIFFGGLYICSGMTFMLIDRKSVPLSDN